MEHPEQEVVKHENGVIHFRRNTIVEYLMAQSGCSIDKFAFAHSGEDRRQFAQLLGITVASYNNLPYVKGEFEIEAESGEPEKAKPEIVDDQKLQDKVEPSPVELIYYDGPFNEDALGKNILTITGYWKATEGSHPDLANLVLAEVENYREATRKPEAIPQNIFKEEMDRIFASGKSLIDVMDTFQSWKARQNREKIEVLGEREDDGLKIGFGVSHYKVDQQNHLLDDDLPNLHTDYTLNWDLFMLNTSMAMREKLTVADMRSLEGAFKASLRPKK